MTTRARRWRREVWLLPLLLAVAGCGPGVGGSGTGEGFALDIFGARAASVCSASFANELKCPSRIVVGPSVAPESEGSEVVLWIDDAASASVTARISGSNVEFILQCDGVRFEGTWGEVPGESSRFFGYFSVPGIADVMPGSLAVGVNGDVLSFELSDVDGKRLFGPFPLSRAESAPTMSSCTAGSASPQAGSTFR